jgi:hypothetical protein
VIQGALALGGLLVAYATWQRPEETPGEAVIVDLSRGDLISIRYDDATHWAEMKRSQEPGGSTWIRYGTREPPPASTDGGASPDGGLFATPPPTPQPKIADREVRGSEAGDKLFEKFEPFKASRALGALDPDKLRELGFDTSSKRLELTSRKGKHSFKVATALGVGTPYIQSEQDQRVYLIAGTAISDLDSAAIRLVDRRLHTFKPSDFDALVIKADDKRRELVYVAKETGQMAKIASKKTPDKADDFARNWHDRVLHLPPIEILGKDERPTSGEPKVGARIEYLSRGKQIGWIDLAEAKATASSASPEFFVRTEHTAGWVKVHAAEELLKEAKKVASES